METYKIQEIQNILDKYDRKHFLLNELRTTIPAQFKKMLYILFKLALLLFVFFNAI